MTTRANAFPIRLAAILIALLTTWSWPGGAAEPQLTLAWIDGDGRTIARRILDRSELQALPQREIATATPWAPGVRRFRGPELGALAAIVPRRPTEAQVAAHNDYTSVIPTADIAEYAPILALTLDDRPMRLRDKGPFWIMYPIDDHPELRSGRYTARMVWQVREIVFVVE